MKRNDSALSHLGALPLAFACACGADPSAGATLEDPNTVTLAYTVSADMGYEVYPSAYVNVSGSPEADYCRFVGDWWQPLLSCKIWDNGWDGDEYGYNSVDGIDLGYEVFPRGFGDVNSDGRADYCRFVGSWPDVFLSCNLAGSIAFEANQYGFNSDVGIDLGYDDMPRQLRDRNGDGLLDFCRYVGDRFDPSECCVQANPKWGGFGPGQYVCYSGPLARSPYVSVTIARGGRSSGSGGSASGSGGGSSASACECSICGGSCGGCPGHLCNAIEGCEPGSYCKLNTLGDYRCEKGCAARSCWSPSDVGSCEFEITLPD